jgi:hypothetical protein
MLRRVALVRTDVLEELNAIITVTRIGELRTTLAITSNQCTLQRNTKCSLFTNSCHPHDLGAKFLRNVGSYKSHAV